MEGGPPCFPRGFTCPAVLWILPPIVGFRLRDSHPLRFTFPCDSPILSSDYAVLNPEGIATSGLASFHFARRYFENRFCFLFLRLLRCFSSAGLPAYCYLIHSILSGFLLPDGFPHSDIPGSIDICSSPRLFAACHVLLRLLMPRHSPCALSSLTNYV